MANYKVTGTITGISPLLQSNPTHHHPSDPIQKMAAPVLKKRQKTEEDHEAIARLSFIRSAHWAKENLKDGIEIDSNGNVTFKGFSDPMIPADMLKAGFAESSKALQNRMGSAFARGVQIFDDVRLEFEGPKECNSMWEAGMYRNDGGSRNGGSLVWITRIAIPRDWQAKFTLMCDTSQVELQVLEDMICAAGKYIGIGSWRPANGGRFGRFTLDEFSAVEAAI
jgi:hypothetical protein|tara:strand:+ start:1793 stop:2464 length:672 start_codon:yes stop_codon:yes gene_type:complete